MAPSITVSGISWLIAPFAPFPLLLFLGALAGWFEMPVISVVKQALVIAVNERERRSALIADAVVVDVSLLVGPPLGVAAVNIWNTTSGTVHIFDWLHWAVGSHCGCRTHRCAPRYTMSGGGLPRRLWLKPGFIAACVGYGAAMAVLAAEGIGCHHSHAQFPRQRRHRADTRHRRSWCSGRWIQLWQAHREHVSVCSAGGTWRGRWCLVSSRPDRFCWPSRFSRSVWSLGGFFLPAQSGWTRP